MILIVLFITAEIRGDDESAQKDVRNNFKVLAREEMS